MRILSIVVISCIVIALPMKSFAGSKEMATQASVYSDCISGFCLNDRLRITLKSGEIINGRLHAVYPDRIEIDRKGAVRSLLSSDIMKIEERRSFWQKVKGALQFGFVVVIFPVIWLLYYIQCHNNPDCS
jgi:hypothetical protein